MTKVKVEDKEMDQNSGCINVALHIWGEFRKKKGGGVCCCHIKGILFPTKIWGCILPMAQDVPKKKIKNFLTKLEEGGTTNNIISLYIP